MPNCKACGKMFMSDSFTKAFCGNPCQPPVYPKTNGERWLQKKEKQKQYKKVGHPWIGT